MQTLGILWMTLEAGLDNSWKPLISCSLSDISSGRAFQLKVEMRKGFKCVPVKRFKSTRSINIPASISSGVFFFFGFGLSSSTSRAGSSDISTSRWSTCLPSSNPCLRPTWTSPSASSRAQTTTQHRVKLSQMTSTSALMPPEGNTDKDEAE